MAPKNPTKSLPFEPGCNGIPGRYGDVKVPHLGPESDGIWGSCFPSKIGSWDRIPNGPYQVSCDRAIRYSGSCWRFLGLLIDENRHVSPTGHLFLEGGLKRVSPMFLKFLSSKGTSILEKMIAT